MAALEAGGIEALVSTAAEGRRRRHDFRPARPAAPRELKADWLKAMAGKLASDESRARYKLRRQTVEPVFGIVKAALGFTGFSLRGLDKVTGEWDLVALAHNCKRLHKLSLTARGAPGAHAVTGERRRCHKPPTNPATSSNGRTTSPNPSNGTTGRGRQPKIDR